jgi:hypothetical protein
VQPLTFDQLLEGIDALPIEHQESLLSVVRGRLRERRREEFGRYAREAREMFYRGELRGGTEDDLMRDLDGTDE